jgi:NAD-dependent DNA ligase
MYVVDPFKGEAYKKLIAENCRVYGSGALISSLALKVPIKHTAKAFSHGGLISMAMCGLNVCFTNIRSEMRSVLIQKSLQMGADVHTHMSTEVTHLVVGETQSKKYIVACENNITTVTEKWVEDLWEISVKLLRPIVPDRSEDFKRITEANKCPVFHGATICASNVSADEKAKLARLIDDNGGNYSAQLDKNRCTHLVMGMPGGKKHKYAMQWGMTITKPNWITDSIEKGFAQSWQLNQYKVDKPSKTSSSSTTFEETSTAEPRYVVEDTCQATALHAPQDEQAELEIMLDKIKNCDITDDLFDSMIFCVTGFNKRQREQLCKIIKDRGGMIFEKVSSSVTHVLASRTDIHSNPEVTLVKRMTGPRPHVIDIYFVLDSINYGDPPIEEDYVIMDPNGTIQNSFEKRRKELFLYESVMNDEDCIEETFY